jgi:hypothetical protein
MATAALHFGSPVGGLIENGNDFSATKRCHLGQKVVFLQHN